MIPTIPKNVAAKNAANPVAALISRLVNHPSSPIGTPNTVPARRSACIPEVELCAIQVEYRLMQEGVQQAMAETTPSAVVLAVQVARDTALLTAPNGLRYASFGENTITASDLERMVQSVPTSIAAALARKAYYFVPLALTEGRGDSAGHRSGSEETMIAPAFTPELAEIAICHRNVPVPSPSSEPADGVFISTRLLTDRFSLAFEFFINIGHAFVDETRVPSAFSDLVWNQALADVRGETSQDAWESRNASFVSEHGPASQSGSSGKPRIDEKAKSSYLESAFSDAVAIYLLSLAVDFDYSELREREYPLLAPHSLAERLRLTATLFPPNPTYEFSIRYRRRA
jgi:hypothetical protein